MSLLLHRHARAGDREEWEGDDRVRPIDKRGRKQAEALVDALAGFAIDRIVSSPYLRCIESVEPLAEARGLEIELDERLAAHRLDDVPELLEELDGRARGRVHARRASVARGPEVQEGLDLGAERRARAQALHQAACLGGLGLGERLENGSFAQARPRDHERHVEPSLSLGEHDDPRGDDLRSPQGKAVFLGDLGRGRRREPSPRPWRAASVPACARRSCAAPSPSLRSRRRSAAAAARAPRTRARHSHGPGRALPAREDRRRGTSGRAAASRCRACGTTRARRLSRTPSASSRRRRRTRRCSRAAPEARRRPRRTQGVPPPRRSAPSPAAPSSPRSRRRGRRRSRSDDRERSRGCPPGRPGASTASRA